MCQTNVVCFFFSSRRRHTRFDCDWSSDVCSSDLAKRHAGKGIAVAAAGVAAAAIITTAASAANSGQERKSTRLNSSHRQISYAVFCLKKKKKEYLMLRSHND